jgi:hypothetical protein
MRYSEITANLMATIVVVSIIVGVSYFQFYRPSVSYQGYWNVRAIYVGGSEKTINLTIQSDLWRINWSTPNSYPLNKTQLFELTVISNDEVIKYINHMGNGSLDTIPMQGSGKYIFKIKIEYLLGWQIIIEEFF